MKAPEFWKRRGFRVEQLLGDEPVWDLTVYVMEDLLQMEHIRRETDTA